MHPGKLDYETDPEWFESQSGMTCYHFGIVFSIHSGVWFGAGISGNPVLGFRFGPCVYSYMWEGKIFSAKNTNLKGTKGEEKSKNF